MPDSHWNQGIILGRIRRPSTCMGCHENSALGFGLGGSGGDRPPPRGNFGRYGTFALQPGSLAACSLSACCLATSLRWTTCGLQPCLQRCLQCATCCLQRASYCLQPCSVQPAACSLAALRYSVLSSSQGRYVNLVILISLTKTLACASESVPNLQPGSLQSGWAALAEDLSRGDVHCPVLQVGQLDNS